MHNPKIETMIEELKNTIYDMLKNEIKRDCDIIITGINIFKFATSDKYDIYVNFTYVYNIEDAVIRKNGVYYPLHDKIIINKMAVNYDEYI